MNSYCVCMIIYAGSYILLLKCGSNIVKTDIKLDIKWLQMKIKMAIKVFIANDTNSLCLLHIVCVLFVVPLW
jgi:hypothetical protein